MVNGDDSFKRPGAVPFNWEIRPGVPKTQPDDDDVPTLIQPPKKLPPLRLKPLSLSPSPSLSSSSSSSYIYDSKSRPVSPFAPPSFKLKPSPSSRPLTPYFPSSSTRNGLIFGDALPRCFPKSLFGLKKSKNDDVKKTGQVSSPSSSTSESDDFYESETTFTPSEESSQRSVTSSSTRRSSPKSFLSSRSLRGSPLRRNKSDLSSYLMRTKPF
ncbi:hypothetical protein V5N11_022059 [Cardamine amara subsp. amara]|uniref:Uncharacterized protein n=1 Tax=Cardamine amara subsp. amara TaxID=228776 RepID=A0ABD1AUR6_CARAN